MSTRLTWIRGSLTAALLAAVSASWGRAAPAHLSPASAGYRVVVNAANPAASVRRSYVSRIFLKKLTRWTDGTLAAPVDLPEADPVREAF